MKLKMTTIGVCALLTGTTQLIAQETKQPQVKGVEIKTAKATVAQAASTLHERVGIGRSNGSASGCHDHVVICQDHVCA